MCLDLESNPQPLGVWDSASITCATWLGQQFSFLSSQGPWGAVYCKKIFSVFEWDSFFWSCSSLNLSSVISIACWVYTVFNFSYCTFQLKFFHLKNFFSSLGIFNIFFSLQRSSLFPLVSTMSLVAYWSILIIAALKSLSINASIVNFQHWCLLTHFPYELSCSFFLICWIILDCILEILNIMRSWVLFKSCAECWHFNFSRLLIWLDSGCKL